MKETNLTKHVTNVNASKVWKHQCNTTFNIRGFVLLNYQTVKVKTMEILVSAKAKAKWHNEKKKKKAC